MQALALTVVALALAVAGCGGGDDETTTVAPAAQQERTPPEQDPTLSPAYVKRGEAICTDMVAAAKRRGLAFRSQKEFPSDPLQLTTSLIAPAIPILASSAKRFRALGASDNPDFEAYVGVYDPILALLRQRVEAGEDGDRERAQELDLQLLDMVALQRQLASSSGLGACDVDFIEAFANPRR
jgi:hypothetical protein